MKKINVRIVRAAVLVFLIVLGFGLMKYFISLKEDPRRRSVIEMDRFVNAQKIVYETIEAPVKSGGRIISLSNVELIAEASGKILKGDIELKKGASFKAGDVLFTIYPNEVSLALKASKSRFLNTLANMLPDISIDYNEYEDAFRKFFSSIDLDKDLPDFPVIDSDKLKLFLSSKNVLSEYYNIKIGELQLKRHSFVAPFSGSITNVNLETGSYTNTGGRIASVIRTDIMEMEVPLDIYDADWAKIGDKVIIVSKERGLTWDGIVVRKSKFVDENTQSQIIFVRIGNGTNSLQPVKNVMEIPRNAVTNSNEVFLIKNGRLTKTQINIVKSNESTLLFNGLNTGDTIVTQQLIGVSEGLPAVMIGSEEAKRKLDEANEKSNKNGPPQKR